MDGNWLEELPAEFFAHTPDLTLLDVSENQLQRWSFRHLTKLKTLDLRENPISQLPADAFQRLTALETLNLRDNKLSELQSSSSRTSRHWKSWTCPGTSCQSCRRRFSKGSGAWRR